MFKVRPSFNVFDAVMAMDHYDIYKIFIGEVDLERNISSPLRHGDVNPSFRLRKCSDGIIRFIDYGAGVRGDIINFVGYKYQISDFDAAIKILNFFPDDVIPNLRTISTTKREVTKKKVSLKVRIRTSDDDDIIIWNKWGITVPTLKKFKVYPVDRYYLNNSMIPCKTKCYAYSFVDGWKIYRPYEKDMRFVSGSLVHQGLDLLPINGKNLVIQKSYKDVMFMNECDIASFAPHSESILIEENIILDLKERFDNIYIWGDNDRQGQVFANNHSEKYDIKSISNLDEYKDITDSCFNKGKEYAISMVNKLIE